MDYISTPNLLLEALSYLGRQVNGSTWDDMDERIFRRGITPSEPFSNAMDRLKALTAELDRLGAVEEPELFRNVEGFPRNTIGTASPAFWVFYGMLERYHGDFSAIEDYAASLDPERRAYHMALALDLTDDYPGGAIPEGKFLDMVLGLSVPDGSKVAILSTYRDFPGIFRRMAKPVRRVLSALEARRAGLDALSQVLGDKILLHGCENYLARTSRLEPAEGMNYRLRPFLFGMDTALTSLLPGGDTCVYCGILREELLEMLSGQTSPGDSVYEAFKLLGDRTRFDLICYLRDHSAYGQELSSHFGLSRNTIHHHMSKLSASGLVRCTTSGNRVYYSLDHRMIAQLLRQQRELFGCDD